MEDNGSSLKTRESTKKCRKNVEKNADVCVVCEVEINMADAFCIRNDADMAERILIEMDIT